MLSTTKCKGHVFLAWFQQICLLHRSDFHRLASSLHMNRKGSPREAHTFYIPLEFVKSQDDLSLQTTNRKRATVGAGTKCKLTLQAKRWMVKKVGRLGGERNNWNNLLECFHPTATRRAHRQTPISSILPITVYILTNPFWSSPISRRVKSQISDQSLCEIG